MVRLVVRARPFDVLRFVAFALAGLRLALALACFAALSTILFNRLVVVFKIEEMRLLMRFLADVAVLRTRFLARPAGVVFPSVGMVVLVFGL